MNNLKRKWLIYFVNTFSKGVSKKQTQNLIKLLALHKGINLIQLAYNSVGILNYADDSEGETFFIKNILPGYLPKERPLLFFDVGANIGNYSMELAATFPHAKIISFEPTLNSFQQLKQNSIELNVVPVMMGLGATSGISKIFTSSDNGHNTLHREVLERLLVKGKINEESITITTIDEYCIENNIHLIDFLKIDVEGNEYAVLKGAYSMLSNQKIPVIQFEFNEMNISARVFLKDFYDILPDYLFYRILPNRLLPIFEYSSMNEIFQFQNIVAIRKDKIV